MAQTSLEANLADAGAPVHHRRESRAAAPRRAAPARRVWVAARGASASSAGAGPRARRLRAPAAARRRRASPRAHGVTADERVSRARRAAARRAGPSAGPQARRVLPADAHAELARMGPAV